MEDQERKRKAVLTQARRNEVEGRLRKLGWLDDDFHAMKNKLLWRAFLSIPEPLSEKAWEEVLPALVHILENHVRERPEKEQRERQIVHSGVPTPNA
ncbi:hypothetical protein FS749_012624 [Ceratobasidium sp. UAMH 11750]|nr:hypothetical protein FS749_012624 [Ceratobasidium sp. UAMH 11750]